MACGLDLRFALAQHHIVPRSLGGKDTAANLTTLCANCHRAVHWLAVGRRLEGAAGERARRALGSPAFRVVASLARRIRKHRRWVLLAGNRWIASGRAARGLIPLADALERIIVLNGFEPVEASLLKRTVRRVLRAIPSAARGQCSYRLVRGGRFMSVNANNHLVFRAPAFEDDGTRTDHDVLLIWPQDTRPSVVPAARWRKEHPYRFAAVACVNLGLTFDDVLGLGPQDWRTFGQGCLEALDGRRTRSWVSNIAVEWR